MTNEEEEEMTPEARAVSLLSPWATLARGGRIREAVRQYVQDYDWVTFAELDREFGEGGYAEVRGNCELRLPGAPNCVVWASMGEEWADLLCAMLTDHELYPYPASYLTYIVDGAVLKLPIAKRPPRTVGYKSAHWLPVCLRVIPMGQRERPGAKGAQMG